MKETCYVYILLCGDGSFYTGATKNLEQRVAYHKEGKGSRYTRSHLPVLLVYQETYNSWREALRREAAIKQLSRAKKEALVQAGRGREEGI